jgi:hypothetical protein
MVLAARRTPVQATVRPPLRIFGSCLPCAPVRRPPGPWPGALLCCLGRCCRSVSIAPHLVSLCSGDSLSCPSPQLQGTASRVTPELVPRPGLMPGWPLFLLGHAACIPGAAILDDQSGKKSWAGVPASFLVGPGPAFSPAGP